MAVIHAHSEQFCVCGTPSFARAGTNGAVAPPAEIVTVACRATFLLVHEDWHTPPWQVWLPEQALPQLPQLDCEVRDVSHPVDCLLASQSPHPLAQEPLQAPLPQVRVAMFCGEQTTQQPPQLSGSFCTLTQVLPHWMEGGWQLVTHWAPEQAWLAPQALPQAPQFLLSVCRFTH